MLHIPIIQELITQSHAFSAAYCLSNHNKITQPWPTGLPADQDIWLELHDTEIFYHDKILSKSIAILDISRYQQIMQLGL
jgi:hypothetical protein